MGRRRINRSSDQDVKIGCALLAAGVLFVGWAGGLFAAAAAAIESLVRTMTVVMAAVAFSAAGIAAVAVLITAGRALISVIASYLVLPWTTARARIVWFKVAIAIRSPVSSFPLWLFGLWLWTSTIATGVVFLTMLYFEAPARNLWFNTLAAAFIWGVGLGSYCRYLHSLDEEGAIISLEQTRQHVIKLRAERQAIRGQKVRREAELLRWRAEEADRVLQEDQRRFEDEERQRAESIRKDREQREEQLANEYLQSNWHDLRGTDFEDFLQHVFSNLGAQVSRTRASHDHGVDLIVTFGSRRIAVQAKGYAGTVGIAAIHEVVSGSIFHGCEYCMVITNSQFARPARKHAKVVNCQLVDRDGMVDLIRGRFRFLMG